MFSHEKIISTPPETEASQASAVTWQRLLCISLVLGSGISILLVLPDFAGSNPVGLLMALLSGICAQRPGHSYSLFGVQLPLEARMMGIYVGLAAGIIELMTLGRECIQNWPRPPLMFVLTSGFGVMVADGVNALLFDLRLPHAYVPDLRLRLLTGLLAGIALAFTLLPLLAQITPAASLKGAPPRWSDVGWSLLGGGVFPILVTSGWRPLLYPVASLAHNRRDPLFHSGQLDDPGGVTETENDSSSPVVAALETRRRSGWVGNDRAGSACRCAPPPWLPLEYVVESLPTYESREGRHF